MPSLSNIFANPKSATLQDMLVPTKILAALMSRWTMLFLSKYSSPSVIWKTRQNKFDLIWYKYQMLLIYLSNIANSYSKNFFTNSNYAN